MHMYLVHNAHVFDYVSSRTCHWYHKCNDTITIISTIYYVHAYLNLNAYIYYYLDNYRVLSNLSPRVIQSTYYGYKVYIVYTYVFIIINYLLLVIK